MDLRAVGLEGRDWIHRAEDRNQWWAALNTAVNFWAPYRWGISCLPYLSILLASHGTWWSRGRALTSRDEGHEFDPGQIQ